MRSRISKKILPVALCVTSLFSQTVFAAETPLEVNLYEEEATAAAPVPLPSAGESDGLGLLLAACGSLAASLIFLRRFLQMPEEF